MQIEAIVSDLDDTLLDPTGQLSAETIRVLKLAMERGIRVIPASGRAARSMEKFVRQLDTCQPYIAFNGAQIISAEHAVLQSAELSPQEAGELAAYFAAHGMYVHCYRDDCFYYERECDDSRTYRRASSLRGFEVGSLAEALDFSTPKLLIVSEPERIAQMYDQARKDFPNVSFTISKPQYLEAQATDVSKGNALRELAALIGLKPETTLVFGDSLNDVSMIEFGIGVAMGNARDEVKRAAKFVCGTNAENGVARFIEENVLS